MLLPSVVWENVQYDPTFVAWIRENPEKPNQVIKLKQLINRS